MHKKIAILYYGLLRSFESTYNSHVDNLYKVLSDYGIDYKIYVHTWKTINDTQRVWNKIVAKKQNYDSMKLIDYHKCQIDPQDDFEKSLKFNDYFDNDLWNRVGDKRYGGEWPPILLLNYLCSIESQKRCFQMVKMIIWILIMSCSFAQIVHCKLYFQLMNLAS